VRLAALGEVLRNREQLRLNLGIFALHVVHLAIFVVIPVALVRHGGLALGEHWKIYLPVVIGSFAVAVPLLVYAERRHRMKALFLGAIALLLAVELGFAVSFTNLARRLIVLLFVFFVRLPTSWRRACPRSFRGSRRRRRGARRSASTTRPRPWACSSGARPGGGSPSMSAMLRCLYSEWRLLRYGWERALQMRVPGQIEKRVVR